MTAGVTDDLVGTIAALDSSAALGMTVVGQTRGFDSFPALRVTVGGGGRRYVRRSIKSMPMKGVGTGKTRVTLTVNGI